MLLKDSILIHCYITGHKWIPCVQYFKKKKRNSREKVRVKNQTKNRKYLQCPASWTGEVSAPFELTGL